MAYTDTELWNLTELSLAGKHGRLMIEVQAYDSSTGAATWCDLNKLKQTAADDLFYNRLLSPPQDLSQDCEIYSGRFSTRISTIELDNSDGAFCKPLPWTVYDADGTACDLPTWYRARLRVRMRYDDNATAKYATLGTFVIEQITPRYSPRRTATIKLSGLEKILMDAKAQDFREGDTWWTNIPADRAAKELVTLAMVNPITGATAASFETGSPEAASIDLPDGEYEVSALGNFPPRRGTAWNRDSRYIPRHTLAFTYGGTNYVAWAGYGTTTNKPSLILQDGTTWTVYSPPYTESDLPLGYEAVFVAAKSDGSVLYLFCVSNSLDSTQPYPGLNHTLKILRFNVSSLSWAAASYIQTSVVYMMNFMPWRENRQFTVQRTHGWGSITGYTGRPALPVFFESRPDTPDPRMVDSLTDTSYQSFIYCQTDNGVNSARSRTGISDSFTDGEAVAFEVFNRTLSPGCYGATKYTGPDGGPYYYYPARTWLHADHSANFQFNASRGSVYYIHYVHTSNYWRVERLNCADGTRTTHKLTFGTLSWSSYSLAEGNAAYWCAFVPTAFGFTSSSALYVATVTGANSYDTAANFRPPPYTRIFNFSVPTSGAATLTYTYSTSQSGVVGAGDWASSRLYALISLRYFATASTAVVGQLVNLWKPSVMSYGFWELASTYDHVYTGHISSHPMSSAPFIISSGHTADGKLYAIDQATGQLWEIADTASGHSSRPLTAYPVDGVSTWASCPPIAISDTIYGVACGAPPASVRCGVRYNNQWAADNSSPQLGYYTPGGRITLWQYGNALSNVVKVADFGDSTVWDALEMLREISGDFVMGFNASGEFYFRPRSTEDYKQGKTSSDYNLCRRGARFAPPGLSTVWIPADTLESVYDYSKLVNSVNVPVFEEELKPPQYDMILRPESHADAIGMTVQQTNTKAQRVVLRCISSGIVPASADTTNTGEALLFGFQRVEADIQGSLSAARQPTDSAFSLGGLYPSPSGETMLGGVAIHAGDTARVGDGNLVTITSVSTSFIFTSAPIGGSDTHPAGTPVVITPADKYRTSSSRNGLCVGTDDPNGVQVNLSSAVNGIVKIYVDSSARVKQGMALCYPDKQLYLQVLAVHEDIVVDDAREIIGALTVKVGVLGSNSASYTGSLTDVTLMGLIWVDKPNKTYAISDYGVSVAFHESSSSSPLNRAFCVGDVIRITCYGLGVNEIENSMSRSINTASVMAHGKKEWRPPRVNRLIDSARARWMLSILDHLTTVRWETTASGCPLLVGPGSGDGVNVYDDYYWPDATSNLQTHTITGYTLNLRDMTSKISMMSTAAAPVGKQPISDTDTGKVRGDRRGERTTRRRG